VKEKTGWGARGENESAAGEPPHVLSQGSTGGLCEGESLYIEILVSEASYILLLFGLKV